MRQFDQADLTDQISDLFLPKIAAATITRYEALTEAERRSAAAALLRNPVFGWVLVDLQVQAVEILRFGQPDVDPVHQRSILRTLDQVLGAVLAEAAEQSDGAAG